jgi:LTXXQ motif family protein
MKKLLIIALVLTGFTTLAQNKNQQDARAKLEAARIALITERLGLTPEQAQQFWPIYNEYAEQRRMIQQEYRQARNGLDMKNLTEEQSRALVKARMEGKQRQLNLETKYSDRLMNVINTRQLMALKKAEDDFRAMIIRRIEQRKRQQLQRQQMMLQRERKLKQGNN